MTSSIATRLAPLRRVALLVPVFALTTPLMAQSVTETYELQDVWFTTSHSIPGNQMTGTFEWTYTPGDFENGTGQFLDLTIPWYGSNFQALIITIDQSSIEFTLPGNFHNLGVDVTLRLARNLSPDQHSTLDLTRSTFTIETGPNQSTLQGNIRSGVVVPVDPFHSYCFGDGGGIACPCNNLAGYGEGCANSTGNGARLELDGSPSAAADDLTFRASGLPPGSLSLLFAGTTPAGGGAGVTLGDGLLCVGGAITRLELTSASTGGNVAFGPGLRMQGGWVSGTTRYFQAWHRDQTTAGCGSGSNLTNAMSVRFTP